MEIRLPELSGREETAVITLWRVGEGGKIEKGDDLVELVTDKAAFDMPAPCSGILVKIVKKQGDEVKKGDIIAVVENNLREESRWKNLTE
ncbi:MAG: lipoyl domain-containing protein [Candidatus Omnitrophota bacterium]